MTETEQMPEAMVELLKWIDLPEYRLKVKKILEQYWSIFSNIPASKSGRYHHVTENFKPYGLINHTFRCLEVAKLLCEQQGLRHQLDRDMIYSALVIHDVGKVFYYEVGIRYPIDHSEKAASIALEAGLPQNIVDMVAHHMSHWDGYPLNGTFEQIVAYADYVASKPDIELKNVKVFRPEQFPAEESKEGAEENIHIDNPLEQYYDINEEIKALEKQKEEIRGQIIDKVKPDKTLIIGNYCANINERNQTDIDRKLLQRLVSADILTQVTKTSTSTVLSIDCIG